MAVTALQLAIHEACSANDLERVREICESSVACFDVNAANNNEETPLSLSCSLGHSEIALLLISHGADVSRRDKAGFTPLHRAAALGHTQTVHSLLSHTNADPLCVTENGETPLCLACKFSHTQTAVTLLQDDRVTQNETVNPLIVSVIEGSVSSVETLLKHNFDPNQPDKNGLSALVYAAHVRSTEIISLLIESGGKLTHVDQKGRNLLTIAKECDNQSVVSALIGDVPADFHFAFQACFSTRRLIINSDQFDDSVANRVLWKNLTFLTEIDLRNCNLHCIPFEFHKLSSSTLKVVRLTGNPWVGFHRTLIETNPSVTTLLSESEKSLQGADISCLEVKVNLLGEPGVGKSTLLRRMRGVTSASDEMSQQLKGKSLATEVLDSAEFTIDGIRFVCYDFGGQHLYRHAHSLFLSPHSICLLCIDLTEIDSILKGHLLSWMDAIVQRSVKVTVIVVGTKCRNSVSTSAVSDRMEGFEALLKTYYPNLFFGFIGVDSLCDDGIQRLRGVLVHLARKKSLRVPRVMYDLRVFFNSLSDAALPRTRVLSLLSSLSPSLSLSPKVIKQAIRALHVIGDIVDVRWMSYEDASAAFTKSVYIILKPQVLIHLFRSVIALVGPHVLQIGVLSRLKISHHWTRIIPDIYHEAIARLFDQLGVMVPIDSERFLVPSLLPDCKPDLQILALKEASIVLRRSFLLKAGVTLPLGVIGHMIAATIRWGEGGKITSIWRTGCVVFRDDILFSVRSDRVLDPPQEAIHLKVSSKQKGKNVTFAFLHFQGVMRNLFTNFYKLEYSEIIPYDVEVSDWTTLDAVVDARERNTNVVTWTKSRGKVWLSQICPDILLEDLIIRIPKDQIQFMETLKSRDDGRVIKASIPKALVRRKLIGPEKSSNDEERVLAAVRLKDEKLTSETILTANREAYIMASLNNPYILSLYGVCTDYQTPLLIMEYMDHGDLRTFLEDPLGLSRKVNDFFMSFEQKRQKYIACPMIETLHTEMASLRFALEHLDLSEVKDAMNEVIQLAEEMWGSHAGTARLYEMKSRALAVYQSFFPLLSPVSLTLLLRMASDIVCGLAVLHSFSPPLVHNDLSASHSFLTRKIFADISDEEIVSNTFVKIGDFRNSEFIFKNIQRDDASRFPKISYSAPEILQKQPYTTKSDIYSLGLLLWQLRYRVPPFSDFSSNEESLRHAIVHGERPPLQFHDDYDELLTHCWRSNPLFRPTVNEIHVTLRGIASAYCPDLAENLPILDQSLPNSFRKEASLPDTFEEGTTIALGQGVTSLSYARSKSVLTFGRDSLKVSTGPAEAEGSKSREGKSSRISCSAFGDPFLWFGCTNGTIGCLSTRQQVPSPIYVDDSLLSEQRPSVTAMAYISSTHTIWISNNSMDLQVWDAAPIRGHDEGERMRHSDMVEVSRKSFMISKEETVRLTLIGGALQWQTSKAFHSLSLETVINVHVTPNPTRLTVTTTRGETIYFKTNDANYWASILQRCMWAYDQNWVISKIAEWKKDRVDVKGPGYVVTSLQAIDGNAWSFDGSLFLKEWKIQTTHQQSYSLKSLEVSRLIRLDVNPKDLKCQVLPNMILHVMPEELWACVSDRFFRVRIRTYLSSQPLLEQGTPVLDPQGSGSKIDAAIVVTTKEEDEVWSANSNGEIIIWSVTRGETKWRMQLPADEFVVSMAVVRTEVWCGLKSGNVLRIHIQSRVFLTIETLHSKAHTGILSGVFFVKGDASCDVRDAIFVTSMDASISRFDPVFDSDVDVSVFDRLTALSHSVNVTTNRIPFHDIFDDSKNPLVTLEEAVMRFDFDFRRHLFKLKRHLVTPEIQEKIQSVRGMSVDMAGSIWLYTMESPLYKEINTKLRDGDDSVVRHYFPFLRIFLSALNCLRDQDVRFRNVNRGVRCDVVSSDPDSYQIGKTILFSSFTSTTATVSVLKSPLFFGEIGPRTIYQIHTSRAIDISPFAAHHEAEMLLPCGVTFKVVGVLPAGNGLTVVQLEDDSEYEIN